MYFFSARERDGRAMDDGRDGYHDIIEVPTLAEAAISPPLLSPANIESHVSLVDADPKALVTSDAEGLTPLQRARVRREGEDIVRFLEEKTDTAKKVSDAFPGIGEEEFARKFKMWEAL